MTTFQPSSVVLILITIELQPLLRNDNLDTIICPPNETSVWSVGSFIRIIIFTIYKIKRTLINFPWSLSKIFIGSFVLVLISLCSIFYLRFGLFDSKLNWNDLLNTLDLWDYKVWYLFTKLNTIYTPPPLNTTFTVFASAAHSQKISM